MVAMEGCGDPEYRPRREDSPCLPIEIVFLTITKHNRQIEKKMEKHETERIEKLCRQDFRYEEWKAETELKRKEDGCKEEAAVIWAEATKLLVVMYKAGHDRNIVFERWGAGLDKLTEKAVKEAAFYILCHPEYDTDEVENWEWHDIKNQIGRTDSRKKKKEKIVTYRAPKYDWRYSNFHSFPDERYVAYGIVEENLESTAINIREIKKNMRSLSKQTEPLGYEALSHLLSLINYFNHACNGALQQEVDSVYQMQKKAYEEDYQRRKMAEQAECPFSKEELAITHLKQHAGVWTTAMQQMLHHEARRAKGSLYADDDYCAAFLAVFRRNGEYQGKGELTYFFEMMKRLFHIDCEKGNAVLRYVEINGFDFGKWKEGKTKQGRRKELALELEKKKNALLKFALHSFS